MANLPGLAEEYEAPQGALNPDFAGMEDPRGTFRILSGIPLVMVVDESRLEGRAGPVQMTFLESHPLIRGMDVYGSLVDAAANPKELPTTAPAGFQGPSGADVDNSSARARAGAAFPTPRNLETP